MGVLAPGSAHARPSAHPQPCSGAGGGVHGEKSDTINPVQTGSKDLKELDYGLQGNQPFDLKQKHSNQIIGDHTLHWKQSAIELMASEN